MPTSPRSGKPGSRWVTMPNGTHVLMDGQGNPTNAVWRERLAPANSRRVATVDAAMGGALSTALGNGYALTDPKAMTARAVTTSEAERAAAAKRLDDATVAATQVPLHPGQDEALAKVQAARLVLNFDEGALMDAMTGFIDGPRLDAAKAEMRAARKALLQAQVDYQATSNRAEVMAEINKYRPPGTEVDVAANTAILDGQRVPVIIPDVNDDIKAGKAWLAANVSAAALKDRVTRHNWDWDGSDPAGLPTVEGQPHPNFGLGGSFDRSTNRITLNSNPNIDPDMVSGTYVHEMTHWLADTPRGSWAQGAVYDRATAGQTHKVLAQAATERQVFADGDVFSQPYAKMAYQTRVGRRFVTHSTETASTAVEDLYRDPGRLAHEDPTRFKLALALIWGDDASLDSLIQPPKAAPKRRKGAEVAAWYIKGGRGDLHDSNSERDSRVSPGQRPVDGGRPDRGGAQRGLHAPGVSGEGRADERLAAGLPGRRGAEGDGDGQYPGTPAGGGLLTMSVPAQRLRLLRVTLDLGAPLVIPAEVKAKAAKPKARAKPKTAAGDHWVTINGNHVLMGGDGQPVDPDWRARLQRKPKDEGGPPVGLDYDPETDPHAAWLRRATAAQQAEADARAAARQAEAEQQAAVLLQQTLDEATTAKSLVEKAGLSKDAALEQARWEHMPFDKAVDPDEGGNSDHINTVYIVDGHDAQGAAMRGVFKPPPSQGAASIESSLAYYDMDQLLGTGVVPPTVLRTVKGDTLSERNDSSPIQGTLQKFVPGFTPAYTMAPDEGASWGFGSEHEIVRYPEVLGHGGLNQFQLDLIDRHPDNSQRLRAAMVLDTILGNVDRHNNNWGLDSDGRLWLTDNDTGDTTILTNQNRKRRSDKAPLTMAGVRTFMKSDAQGFAIPADWLRRWRGITRPQFDAALRNLDDIDPDWTRDMVNRDQLWDNFQSVIRHGGIDGESTFGDKPVRVRFP